MIADYCRLGRTLGKKAMRSEIDVPSSGVLATRKDLNRLGCRLTTCTAAVVMFFVHARHPRGRTEVHDGRLEYLSPRRALGFRNLRAQVARSFFEERGFRAYLDPQFRWGRFAETLRGLDCYLMVALGPLG
ncbi:hypothetical protein SAMN04489745_1325 [Arthrobacter woluwensis]|uniref:Uncharacterized protein n=1 Tax=Arthrobacter woluwensis TaxID=156980 RepID=A0A1H4MEL4_9MICC|nr:hypothetical protein SAMN04489745_1325 [Arthrobacter woluwensis]